MNDPKVEKQKPVPPFVQFCCAAVPMVFDDSLSYYEALCAMWKYLDETVKVINNNALVTEDYIAKVEELKAYVEHYFDNLDVQEEINNKLDEMVTTGQLQALVNSYFLNVDEKIARQDEKIEEQTATINSAISTQNASISQLDSRMDSFTNLEEGSTTGDAELIDGRISFTGRTADNIGGNIRMYQGSAFTSILSDLTKVESKSVNYHLEISDNANYDYYVLPTKKGHVYLVDVNATGAVRNVVLAYGITYPASTASNVYRPFTFIGTGATVYINNAKSYLTPYVGEMANKAEVDELAYYYNDITSNATKVEGKFIRVNGTEASLNTTDYYSFTPKAGHYYYIYTACSVSMPLAYQNGKVYPDDSGSYSTPQAWYKIYSQNTDTIKVNTMNTQRAGAFKIYESKYAYNVSNSTSYNLEPTVGAFSKAVFIGDSLTNGATIISNTSPTSYTNYYNYPYFLNKMMKFDSYTKLARNGATASDWWNEYNDQLTETDCTYFIWLGTNSGLTDTVATDCAGSDYTQFANSNTGNLGKIMGKISALSNVKIVILTVFITGGDKTDTNKAIRDLATKYNAVVIDMDKDICRETGYHTAYNGYYNGTHFNNQGYNLAASLVNDQLSSYMNNNAGSLELYKAES